MSTKTTNYNLIKPEYTDTPDITTMNSNWDIIDTKLKYVDDKIAGYLPLTGGTVTGDTTFKGATTFTKDADFSNSIHDTIQLRTWNENTGAEILFTAFPESNGISFCRADTDDMPLIPISVGAPQTEYDAATKGYVDNNFATKEDTEDFVVNVNNMSSTITSDKTYNEIEAAYNAGKRIYCSLLDTGTLGSPALIPLTIRRVGMSTTDFVFIGSVGVVGLEYSIKISNRNVVTVEHKQFMENRQITAAEVGALPITGGTVTGEMSVMYATNNGLKSTETIIGDGVKVWDEKGDQAVLTPTELFLNGTINLDADNRVLKVRDTSNSQYGSEIYTDSLGVGTSDGHISLSMAGGVPEVVFNYQTEDSAHQTILAYGDRSDGSVGMYINEGTISCRETPTYQFDLVNKDYVDGKFVAGSNITLTPDATNDKITIASNIPTASASILGGVKIGSNISISDGKISVPTASGTSAGVTIVYPAQSCTTYTSDSGTITPLAAQKAAKMFAITRPASSTVNAITRYSNTTGDVANSKIIIEDVVNSKDSSKKAQVIAIPAEGNKKMVYGYCTDQVDGTSFIGGVFDKSATSYPYSAGLAIGGTSGNLLWKGARVATVDDIPTTSQINSLIDAKLGVIENGTY